MILDQTLGLNACSEAVEAIVNWPRLTQWVLILLVGVVLLRAIWFSLKQAIQSWQLKQHCQSSIPPKVKTLLKRHSIDPNQVKLVDSPFISAFVFGLTQPAIFLPVKLIDRLTQRELEAVLLHELHHLKQRHPLMLFLAKLAQFSLGLIVPTIIDLVDYFKLKIELQADRFAIAGQGTDIYLKSAMVRVLSGQTNLGVGFGWIHQARISAIDQQKVSLHLRFNRLGLSLITLGFLVLSSVNNSWASTQATDLVSTPDSLSACLSQANQLVKSSTFVNLYTPSQPWSAND